MDSKLDGKWRLLSCFLTENTEIRNKAGNIYESDEGKVINKPLKAQHDIRFRLTDSEAVCLQSTQNNPMGWRPCRLQTFTPNVTQVIFYKYYCLGTQYHSWLRHYATSQKVAGSNPDEVIGFFN
jgi:hypothetical protein